MSQKLDIYNKRESFGNKNARFGLIIYVIFLTFVKDNLCFDNL